MKKIILPLAGLGFLFTACSLAIPESVSVKTDAAYNFSIGDVKKEFNDKLDKKSLFSKVEESGKSKVYDYFPEKKDEKLQQFILTVDIADIDLNLPAAFKDSDQVKLFKDKTLADALTLLGVSSTFSFDNESSPTEINMDVNTIFNAFDVLGEEFKEKVNFDDISLYIYCTIPGLYSDSVPLKGSIKIENNKTFKWLIGSETEKHEMKLATITEFEKENDVVITDISAKPSSVKDENNMTQFINASKKATGGQKLTYYIDIDGVKIKCNGESAGKLEIKMCLVLPFKFKVNSETDGSDLKIDLLSLSKKSSDTDGDDKKKDIFNRDKATDTKDIEKYLDVIQKAEITYNTKKNPFIIDSGKYRIVPKANTLPKIEKTLEVNGDTVSITGEELKQMLKAYPYNPDVFLNIPHGSSVALPRDIALDINMAIRLVTNGTIKL